MTHPLEKSNELVDMINALLHSEKRSEFGLKQIEREAKKLMHTFPASAHLVLGMLSALKNDKRGLIKHHDLALKLGFDPFLGNQNFSVSLSSIGHFSEALEYARQAYRAEKTPSIIQSLIALNYRAARFEESLMYFLELEKFNFESPENLPSRLEFDEFTSFMKKFALTDSDLATVTGIAESIVLRENLEITLNTFNIYSENTDEWLNIELKINASPKITASLNIQLAEELVVSNTSDFLLDKVSCRFIPDQDMMKARA